MDFYCSAGDPGDSGVYRDRRRISHASVELAAAAPLRLAADYLLASGWNSGAMPDSLRRIWTSRFRPFQIPSPHGRTLGAHDPGRAGTIPARNARRLRLWPIDQREQGAMNRSAGFQPVCQRRAVGVIRNVGEIHSHAAVAGYFLGFPARSARYFLTMATSCGSVADFRYSRSSDASASGLCCIS